VTLRRGTGLGRLLGFVVLVSCASQPTRPVDTQEMATAHAGAETARAADHLQRGDPLQATVHARRATGLDPRHAAAWYYLGTARLLAERPEEAVPALRRAIDLGVLPRTTTAAAYGKLGQAYAKLRRYDEAISAFERSILPGDPEPSGLREAREAKARDQAGQSHKAREDAERKARAEAEQIAKARAEAERAARERAAQAAQARAQAQREAQARAEREAKEAASGLGGADWGRRRPLAEAAVAQAAEAEARGDAGGALGAYHRAWLLVYRDEDEALRGRVEEALARLAARLPEKPAVDEAARRRAVQGDAYFDARRFDEAATAYTRLLVVAPWHAVGRYNLALALAAQERYAEAIAEMRRFLLLVPDGPTARTAQDTIYQWETHLR